MSGHVCQRGKKDQWYAVIDVYEDGKRKRRWHRLEGATGKREAEKACEKLIAQQGDGLYVAPNKQTFQQYFEAWATDWLPMQVGPSTRESYANWGKHLIAAFGAKPIQQIRGGDLNRAYLAAAAKGLSPSTVKLIHVLARRVLGHALRQGDIKRNPCDEIDAPKVAPKEAAILRPEEIPVMLETLRGTALYPIAVVALGTGMRRGELCALTWGAVDLDAGKLEVRQSLEQTRKGGLRFKEPKTKHGRRSISLPPSVVACLQEHRLSQLELRMRLGLGKPPADALVFGSPEGKPPSPNYIGESFRDAMVRAGLPHVTLHSLRHSHASMLIRAGEDIVTVSRRLGHGSPTITLGVYAHVVSTKDGAAAAIEAVLQGKKW